jgi:hypothetical protein
MTGIDQAGYPPAVAELLRELPLAPLGSGRPRRDMLPRLEAVAAAFAPEADRDMVAACQAGLWLAFDYLDESHALSQSLQTPEGAYWHALMHRREPDFWNSKHWFRQVGAHPVFGPLHSEAARLAAAGPEEADFLTRQTTWDPFAFADLCELCFEERGPCQELCRQVQRVEWELLFAHCCRRAVRREES